MPVAAFETRAKDRAYLRVSGPSLLSQFQSVGRAGLALRVFVYLRRTELVLLLCMLQKATSCYREGRGESKFIAPDKRVSGYCSSVGGGRETRRLHPLHRARRTAGTGPAWHLAPEFGAHDPGQVGTLLSFSVLPILPMEIPTFATVSLQNFK